MNKVQKFGDRLKRIGIDITLSGNYPWIYLDTVNGNHIKERFQANHGFTVFMLRRDGTYAVTDIRQIFKIIRKYK